ncbi:hypothetical protein VF34_00625 [Rhodococcus sp. PML026]|jgi:hypothetical protein|nr:hypothetical protein VF34_00625 [Rhodococcus sp. PML026]
MGLYACSSRQKVWKRRLAEGLAVRALASGPIGQGYHDGLAELTVRFGVEVDG